MSTVSSADGGYQPYQRKIGDVEDELRADAKRSRERMSEQTDALDSSYRRALTRKDEQNDATADSIRNRATERIERERENARNEVEREKSRGYDRTGKASTDVIQQQRRSLDALESAQADFDHRRALDQQGRPEAQERHDHDMMTASERAAALQNESHAKETADLRQSVRDLSQADKQYGKEKGLATQEVHREYDDDHRFRENVLREEYQAQVNKAKADLRASDTINSGRYSSELGEKEAEMAAFIKKMNQEHHAGDVDQLTQVNRLTQQQKMQNESSDRSHQAQTERLVHDLGENERNALEHQATTYSQTMRDQSERDTANINRLQGQLNEQMTTSDSTKISPAAEHSIRESLGHEYELNHQANVQRMNAKNESVVREYQKRVNETVADKQQRMTELNTQHELRHQQDRTTYTNQVASLEQEQALAQRNSESQTNRQLDTMTRFNSQALDRQHMDAEQLLAQTRAEAQQRMTALQQKSNFDTTMAQRNFAIQVNTVIREYDKKLNDQKNAYGDQIDELKTQLAQSARDGERRAKEIIDEQTRNSDQKIKQLEFQSKDRERIMSESYEDQLEKMRRSNALLAQKKG
jgi:hypothetical protein